MHSYLEKKMGEPVAILCMRYWYRGFVVELSKEHVVLTHAYVIEQTGPAAAEVAQSEEKIPNDIAVNLNVVELVVQPAWVINGYSKELIQEMMKKHSKKK